MGGVRPQDIGLKVLRGSVRPILPDTRDRTLVIPGRNGSWDFGSDMEPRYFNLDCQFVTRSASDLQYAVETLARLLVDTYGKPKSIELVFAVHSDRVYTVRYSGSLPIERLVGMGRFNLPLIAFDPYAYGTEQVFEDVITTEPYQTTILSEGEIRTEPVIVLVNEGSTTINYFKIVNEYKLEG